MKITGKIISVTLAVILMIGMLPTSVFAEEFGVYLNDPDVVITTTIDPQPDEEPVESPGFNVKVDNWGGSGTEDDPFTIHNRVGMEVSRVECLPGSRHMISACSVTISVPAQPRDH